MEQTKEMKEVNALALSVPDQAKQITAIKTVEDYTRAGEILLTIKEIRKKIEATFKPIKQKMDAAKKEVLDQEKAADRPLAEAEAWIKPLIVSYNAEQERIRREEEERLREIARKEEEERRLQEAIAAEEEAKRNGASKDEIAEVVQQVIDEPVSVAPIVIPKSVPKVAGISMRENWKFRIVNEKLIPREYLKVDDVKIGAIVRALKGATNIPGIEAYNESIINAGRRVA
jgi:hypothetical protein